MRISAKADYAVQAAVVLAAENSRGPLKAEAIAHSQEIPLKFLLNILSDLKRSRIVSSQRGTHGGFQLARPASDISVADLAAAKPLAARLKQTEGRVPWHLGRVGPSMIQTKAHTDG